MLSEDGGMWLGPVSIDMSVHPYVKMVEEDVMMLRKLLRATDPNGIPLDEVSRSAAYKLQDFANTWSWGLTSGVRYYMQMYGGL